MSGCGDGLALPCVKVQGDAVDLPQRHCAGQGPDQELNAALADFGAGLHDGRQCRRQVYTQAVAVEAGPSGILEAVQRGTRPSAGTQGWRSERCGSATAASLPIAAPPRATVAGDAPASLETPRIVKGCKGCKGIWSAKSGIECTIRTERDQCVTIPSWTFPWPLDAGAHRRVAPEPLLQAA